jgi:hypothetical protein
MITLVRLDSLVGLVTNSSSDIFPCLTTKSVEAVQAALDVLLKVCEPDKNPKDCYRVYRFDHVNHARGWALGQSHSYTEWLEPFKADPRFTPPPEQVVMLKDGSIVPELTSAQWYSDDQPFDSRLRDYDATDNENSRRFEAWLDKQEWMFEELAKCVVIASVSDNTVPYEMFDAIEKLFNGKRVHLG